MSDFEKAVNMIMNVAIRGEDENGVSLRNSFVYSRIYEIIDCKDTMLYWAKEYDKKYKRQ